MQDLKLQCGDQSLKATQCHQLKMSLMTSVSNMLKDQVDFNLYTYVHVEF